MTIKKFYYLLMAIGVISGVGAGISTLSVIELAGDLFKRRLLDLFIYPGFVFIGTYSLVLITAWLAKVAIGLNLPRLGEMRIDTIGNGVRRYFSMVYLALGSLLALIAGYVLGVFWAVFYSSFFLI